jgi:hypothetical protein
MLYSNLMEKNKFIEGENLIKWGSCFVEKRGKFNKRFFKGITVTK